MARHDIEGRFDPMTYYRRDLARIHHLGFGFHADQCAPGILSPLTPVRERGGLVVELGCGSGLLTRYLLDAGHRVIATDASEAMLELARDHAPEAEIAELHLPDDPILEADAIVSIGHVLSYLPDEAAVERALLGASRALRPGGVLALDLCDLAWGEARRDASPGGWVGDDWALVTEFSVPSPDRFVRQMAAFTRNEDGTWRRDDERHENVLVDVDSMAASLADHDLQVTVGSSFGSKQLPVGLRTVVAHRSP